MLTQEITICGKAVTLAYCYATEIAYKELSGEDMIDYAMHVSKSIEEQRDPDIKKTIFAVIACMVAYYEDADKAPVKDSDIMNNATPAELGTAIITIMSMRMKFYHVPNGEPLDNTAESAADPSKNA